MWGVVFTSYVFAILVAYLLTRNLILPASVFTVLGIFSILQHSCKIGYFFCSAFWLNIFIVLDLLFVHVAFEVTLFHLVIIEKPKWRPVVNVGSTILAVIDVFFFTGGVFFTFLLFFGFLIVTIFLLINGNLKRIAVNMKYAITGFGFGIIGLFFFGLGIFYPDDFDLVHSLWHITAFFGLLFLYLSSSRNLIVSSTNK